MAAELGPLCGALPMYEAEGVCAALLDYGAEQEKAVRKRLRACLNQLEAQRAMFGGIRFTLAVGPATGDVRALDDSFAQAQRIAQERIVEGTGKLLERLPPPSGVDRARALRGFLAAAEERGVAPQLIEDALAAFAEETRDRARGGELLALTLEAGRLLLQRPEIQDRERTLGAFEAACRRASSVQALERALSDMAHAQLRATQEQQRSGATRPIRVARQYVQQHYHEPITLEQVCEATGFSVSYFSALFKKETGEGFVKYLTRVRMEHARELLQQTSLPVSEICIRVGYNDIKHFTQTFKKETNLNPGQYRKLYG